MKVLKILLERHNYKGELSLPAIISWLETEHKIYLGITPLFEEDDDNNVTFVGYQGIAFCPPYESVYKAAIFRTRQESLIMLITQLLIKEYVQ